MPRLRLIHWNGTEARARSADLRRLGYTADSRLPSMPDLLRELAAIVIDLTRSPSRGRGLGILLRQRMATRLVPLVFAGCAPEKVAGVRELLPDAAFSDWEGIAVALRRAIPRPTAQPVVHASAFAADAGRPLVRRLGIRSGMRVAVVGLPSGFTATLEPLPGGVQLTSRLGPASDLILWFVRRPTDLERKLPRKSNGVGNAHVWIAWQKGGSAVRGDLTQQAVRAQSLAAGLVDYKICSIDSTWSALLSRRRAGKAGKASGTDMSAPQRCPTSLGPNRRARP